MRHLYHRNRGYAYADVVDNWEGMFTWSRDFMYWLMDDNIGDTGWELK
jgi:hypothetical protein